MQDVKPHMHDNLPVFAGIIAAISVLAIKNVAILFSVILSNHTLLQINLEQTFEVFFYGAVGGAAGWVIKITLDQLIPPINKFSTRIKNHFKK